ncbi:MAG: hypothetical protein FD123_1743 [Bacteroidetes bacterium]|nr:MAG: hypothetical protein FD123_1743 [Bacteroidota bacterium]
MRWKHKLYAGFVLFFSFAFSAHAQFQLPGQGGSLRDRMDQERQGINFTDEKAFSKSKEFIRNDSTYYGGWFLQGAFFYFRAADADGFARAIKPLEKALKLIEKDYKWQLRTRTSDFFTFFNVYRRQEDYGFICYYLEQCYQNIEQPDKAMEVLRKVRDKNMQLEFAVEPYNTMSWLYHRNRVYTSSQYSFLKNSVKENNDMAMKMLDSAAWKYQRDYYLNIRIFQPNFIEQQRYGVYHYKAILFAYNFEVDSAEYYYGLMQDWAGFSNNNYANFKYVCADFKTAEEFYAQAASREDYSEKRTREFNYMRGMIGIYKGQPEQSDSLLSKVIEQQGSTPGFGWHSIGLARAQFYQGLTAESQHRMNKANAFHELHIGTTWGQEQYELCIALYNYMNKVHEEKEYMFEHNGFWEWCNPKRWFRWMTLNIQQYTLKMVVASLLANNPERADVIYTLFSSENLMSFDEVWFLIGGFSNDYFIDRYKKLIETDKRKNVKKYFKYFVGRLLLNEGKAEEAETYLKEVLEDKDLDTAYERLLIARCYEALAESYDQQDKEEARMKCAVKFYEIYPQLVPYSDVELPFRLSVTGDGTEEFKTIREEFESCDIEWTEDTKAPKVSVEFKTNGKNREIHYRISGDKDSTLVSGAMVIKKTEDTGKLLAYRIFGIKKKEIGKKVEVPLPKKNKNPKDSLNKTDSVAVEDPV